MRYLTIDWGDGGGENPVRIHVEVGDDDFEVRKIHEFDDGTTQIATEDLFEEDTELGYAETPSNEEIAADSQFHLTVITRRQFENMWKKEYGAYLARTGQTDPEK